MEHVKNNTAACATAWLTFITDHLQAVMRFRSRVVANLFGSDAPLALVITGCQ